MAIARVRVKLPNPAGTGDAYNIWHVRTTGSPEEDTPLLQNAVDALGTFYDGIRNHLTAGTVTVGDSVIWDPIGSPTYANINPVTVTTAGNGASPALLAVTVTWYTNSATRSGRGRTFVGPWNHATTESDGTVNSNQLAALRAAAAGLLADSQSANGWAIGVLSIKQGIFRDATSYAVRDRFAYLSSRRD
jgi:hypothetical protein